MKKWTLILIAILSIAIAGCTNNTSTSSNNSNNADSSQTESLNENADVSQDKKVSSDGFEITNTGSMEIKNYGTIEFELYGKEAPITVENFINLAKDGFYDGLTFHRVINDFMIQGGDPSGNGTGGSDKTIKGEFNDNDVTNNIKHVKGVLSMARSQAVNSASSQFFIVQKDSAHLDGSYAGFGKVTKGMDIVDKIAKTAVDENDKPLKDVVIKSIKIN